MNHEQRVRCGIELTLMLESLEAGKIQKADRHRREMQSFGLDVKVGGLPETYSRVSYALLSARELAEKWEMMPQTVRYWFQQGWIPGFAPGKTRAWFNREACEEYLQLHHGHGAVQNLPPVPKGYFRKKPVKKVVQRWKPVPWQRYSNGGGI